MRKTKKKTVKRKGLFGKSRVKGAKVRKLKNARKKAGETQAIPAVDFQDEKFADENTNLNVEEPYLASPEREDVQDELSHLEGFRDYLDEARGNSLTFGDY